MLHANVLVWLFIHVNTPINYDSLTGKQKQLFQKHKQTLWTNKTQSFFISRIVIYLLWHYLISILELDEMGN